MRPLVSLCLCVGWLLGGGGCSARALLKMKLTTTEPTAVEGQLSVTVMQGGVDLILPEIAAELTVAADAPKKIGIYLPEGTDGSIMVTVALMRETCKVAAAGVFEAIVHPGQATALMEVPPLVRRACPDMTIRPKDDGGA